MSYLTQHLYLMVWLETRVFHSRLSEEYSRLANDAVRSGIYVTMFHPQDRGLVYTEDRGSKLLPNAPRFFFPHEETCQKLSHVHRKPHLRRGHNTN